MEMKLNKLPFEQILSGEKTVEIRLNDEKRSQLREGDKITFISREDARSIQAEVVALYKYPTFLELFKAPLLEKGGFGDMTPEQACECMRKYYTIEQEHRYGVLGIEIKLI